MKSRIFYSLLFAATVFIVNLLIQYFALQSVNVLKISGIFSPQTALTITSSNGIHPIIGKTQVNSGVHNTTQIQTLQIELKDQVVDRFRLDVHHQETEFRLHSISLFSHFFRTPINWTSDQIATEFSKNESDPKTTTFILNNSLKGQDLFLFWVIPLFLGLLVVLVFRNFKWSEFPAYADLRDNQSLRNSDNFESLDGFRGVAALIVLMHHATTTFKGLGDLGVWMFFVLSGFLLTKPFVLNPQMSIQFNALGSFLTRRFKRIVPMYFVMVVIIFLIPHHYEAAIRHFLFIQGDGHYWTILQEIYFYMLIPVLGFFTFMICKGRPLLSTIFLFLVALAWQTFGTVEILSIYGFNNILRVYIEVFLVGMIGAYWYHGIYKKSERLKELACRYQWLLSIIGLMSLFVCLDIARRTPILDLHLNVKSMPIVGALVCLGLILLAVVGDSRCGYKKLLSLAPLRYIGIIGYSFYLIHPYSVFISRYAIEHFFAVEYLNTSEVWRLAIAFALTLAMASFTYSFIERPFLKK